MNESNPTNKSRVVPSNRADGRKLRGLEIPEKAENQISRINHATYRVLSQNGNGEYVVRLSEDEWRCDAQIISAGALSVSISGC